MDSGSAVAFSRRSWSQPPSMPSPMLRTTSASEILATSLAPGWNVCGSLPTGSRLNTSTPSPPTFCTQSATMLDVVTTSIGGCSAGAAGGAAGGAGAAGAGGLVWDCVVCVGSGSESLEHAATDSMRAIPTIIIPPNGFHARRLMVFSLNCVFPFSILDLGV